jgi:hypothetical protein
MKKFYLHNGAEQQGPFDIEELKTMNITKDTLVWHEGISDWTEAEKITDLKELLKTTPPPLKKIKQTLPPPIVKSPVHEQIIADEDVKKKNSVNKNVLIVTSIIVVVIIGFFVMNQAQRVSQSQNQEDNKLRIKNNIRSYVTVSRSGFTYSNLGGISNLSIIVSNSCGYMLDNVRVKVSYIKADGEVWKNEDVDFTYLSPYTQQTLKAPDSERGTTVQYEILSIKSTALGLY